MGWARRGTARRGKDWQARHGLDRQGQARCVLAWQGVAWLGLAGKAIGRASPHGSGLGDPKSRPKHGQLTAAMKGL